MAWLNHLYPVSSRQCAKESTYSSKKHKLGNVRISLMVSDQIIGVGVDEIETWTGTLHNRSRYEPLKATSWWRFHVPNDPKGGFWYALFQEAGWEAHCAVRISVPLHYIDVKPHRLNNWGHYPFDNACTLTDNWLPSGKQWDPLYQGLL